MMKYRLLEEESQCKGNTKGGKNTGWTKDAQALLYSWFFSAY